MAMSFSDPIWATAPTSQPASGRATLRAILGAFGLQDLTDAAYNLYVEGITDPDLLMVGLERTQDFQMRFPGIRDETGQLIMRPSEYVTYERTIAAELAKIGHPPPTRAQIGAIVQSRRSAVEVGEEIRAYDELRQNPYLRRQYYIYTGTDAGDVGIFALALGLAPDLEKSYATAINAGISEPIYQTRLAESQTMTSMNAFTFGITSTFTEPPPPPGTTIVPPEQPTGIQPPPINVFPQPALFRSERIRALRLAELANRAQFKAGGESATTAVRPRTEVF